MGTEQVSTPSIVIEAEDEECGVWTGRLECEGVKQVREHLQKHWDGEGCPLVGSDSRLAAFSHFDGTRNKFSHEKQRLNTLRWRGDRRRRAQIRKHLPGYASIEDAFLSWLSTQLPLLRPHLAVYNAHILRQGHDLGGGSGFKGHVDDADEGKQGLYLSAAVKLTQDPDSSGGSREGSSMQVMGKKPIMYGSEAGSFVVFFSRKWHESLPTPAHMGRVLKLVLFIRFVTPALVEQYHQLLAQHPDFVEVGKDNFLA